MEEIKQVREQRLDSLRGIAAFCVAAGHCVTAWSLEPLYNKTFQTLNYNNITALILRFLYIIFNGEAAVVVFFVLSGYVLTKSLSKINNGYISEFSAYVIKRVYRIIPAVVVSFVPLTYFYANTPLWDYMKNMFLLKVSVNGVTWTLQVEMVASLLVFFIFLISRKAKLLQIPLFILLVILFAKDFQPQYFKFFPAFFLGCYINNIKKHISNIKILPIIAILVLIASDFIFGYNANATIIAETISAVIVVSCVSNNKFFKFLDFRLIKYLGRISFSFYLYHLLGAEITIRLCNKLGVPLGTMPQVANVLVYIAFSIPIAIIAATLSYYLVEKPSMIIGVSLGKSVKDKLKEIPQKISKKRYISNDISNTIG